MKVVYEVKNSYGAIKDDCKAFVLGSEELAIKVTGVQIEKCFVYLENGEKKEKLSIEKLDEFVVPSSVLVAGELKLKVVQFARTKVKTINLEPITLVDTDAGFEGHSAFDDLKARVEVLEKRVAELEPLPKQMSDLYNALEQ